MVKNLLNVKVCKPKKLYSYLFSLIPSWNMAANVAEQPKEWMCTYDDGQVITKNVSMICGQSRHFIC
ncbi:MAG: hypothetical protein ACLU4J_15475 [Butyricimonas paravirosa]